MVGFIPARAGSKRIPGKNWKDFHGKPLICYTIEAAIESGIFDEGICISSNSDTIRSIVSEYKEAEFIERPAELSQDISPDQEWIDHIWENLRNRFYTGYEVATYFEFAILRPTNPFRTAETIKRAYKEWDKLSDMKAVERVSQHPAKMWVVYDDRKMIPLIQGNEHLEQTNILKPFYVQNGCLEFRLRRIPVPYQPFITQGYEGFDINTEDDWLLAQILIEKGLVKLGGEDFPNG